LLSSKSCKNLLSGNHFHVDMYGNFIPPGCTGIIIPLNDAVNGIPGGKYPAFEELFSGGISALFNYAQKFGFVADAGGYPSGCTLCFHIRHWLSTNAPTPELDPEHYRASLKYW